MNVLSTVMQLVSALLTAYLVLLVVRIVLTWVSMDHGHPVLRLLHAICDPYLNWFRRFRFLTIGQLDLSPVAALLVVNFVGSLAHYLAVEGQLSVGIVLAVLVMLVWGAVSFFFILLGVLSLLRFFAVKFRWGGQGLWSYLDAVLQPPAYALGRLLRPRTFLAYTTTLLLLGALSLLSWGVGEILVRLLAVLLHSLPW